MRRRESQMLYNGITNIDSKYIEEADGAMEYIEEANQTVAQKDNKVWKQRILPVAGVLLLFICAITFWKLMKPFDAASPKRPLSVSAAELGKTEIRFGATMPSFLSADADRVVMYDYVGIWEYDLHKKRLSGFCDFRPIGMTQIQGYPYVAVEMSVDGNEVRFYMSDGTKKYLYDVSRNECFEVEDYEGFGDDHFQMKDVTEEKSLSEYSGTYQMGGRKVYSVCVGWGV